MLSWDGSTRMSHRMAFALGLALVLLIGLAVPLSPQHTRQRQPITEDLSHGPILKFKIAPDLPEFTFKVVPEVLNPDSDGNPQSTIQDVQVFRGASTELLQSLQGCEWEEMEPPYKNSDWFRVEDVNFDGYADVFILTNWGATGNEFGCIWLYNPKTGRFEFSKEFSELGTFVLDPATKTITTHANGGAAGTVFNAAKYVVEDNRPVPIIFVSQDYDSNTRKYHCVVQQRRNHENTMVTIRDLWAESKGDFDAPCDAADPFRGIGDK